jgi:uncharacterized repeat protein (TIGR03803 family)
VQDTSGVLYGSTAKGGNVQTGTIFSLSVGLQPFIKTLPASGAVGSSVSILGNNLTGATSVTFNGVTAAFTVASPNLIEATVPEGATTGIVQAATPLGTLSSNVAFTVR